MRHSVAREKTAKARPTRSKAKEARVDNVANSREAEARVVAKSNLKGKGDPLKQRFVSSRLCGDEGHWQAGCPQADVDMLQARRRVISLQTS